MAIFMKKVIKKFWNVLKSEYENKHKENIFKNAFMSFYGLDIEDYRCFEKIKKNPLLWGFFL